MVFDEFSNGVCGNVGDGSTLDMDEDFVSLDIVNEDKPPDVAFSNETLESESSSESSIYEPSDEELHENLDSSSPNI